MILDYYMDKWCVNFLKTLISEVLADLKALSDLDTLAPGSSPVCHYRGNIVLTLMGKLLYSTCAPSPPWG